MGTRRRFIQILPLAGVSLVAACSKKEAATSAPAASPSVAAPTVAAPVEPTAPAQIGIGPGTTPPVAATPVEPAPAPVPAPAPAPAPTSTPAPAAGPYGKLPMVDPADAAAAALGYVAVAAQTNATKFPQYAAGQACSNCALYGGAAGDAAGACPLYPGKHVSAKAWCSAYNKKAA